MVRKIMVAALACAAIGLPAAAPAAPGKGKAAKAERSVGKAAKAASRRAKSQGPANASARAIERASPRSVLGQSSVVAGPLAGLDVGDELFGMRDGSSYRIGSVDRIVPGGDGRVGNVLVRTVDGRVVPVAPRSIAFDSASGQWTTGGPRPTVR